MQRMLPEVKEYTKGNGRTNKFTCIKLDAETTLLSHDDLRELLEMKLWNYPEIQIVDFDHNEKKPLILKLKLGLGVFKTANRLLFKKQGYFLDVKSNEVQLFYEERPGLVNGL